MKHAASRELYAYWEERRGKRPAPERAEIEPGAIRQVLSDAFILALETARGSSVSACRHAGLRAVRPRAQGRVLSSGCGPRRASRSLSDLLAILDHERVGTVAGVTAQNGDGEAIELELLLLPLSATPAKPRPHHRHSGAAQDPAMARFEPDRRADPRQPPAHRRIDRNPPAAALYGAAPASARRPRGRPRLTSPARRDR